ncbi:hypothetical protein CDD82_3443 [Ophiocordyceps australis]|uniref:DUF5672 domain-containing protein n=1 Tax=Ophiocordyceps australis TaxID=1399860 RepID=A0A2C5ZDX4_9HYPO|nr:hypothetical protein CDD82_3443 [Ophiocordyceps australis]
MAVPKAASFLAKTKARLLLVLTLALTWWLACLAPQYRQQLTWRLQQARLQMPKAWLNRHSSASAQDCHGHLNASKVALLIEPRPLPHLVPLLMHMIAVAPPDWRFLFIGSQWSTYSVERAPAVRHHADDAKLAVLQLPEPWSIESPEAVSRLLTDLRFYAEFLPDVEWLLKFGHDSILCANSPYSLDDWLEWSWAGAPRNQHGGFSGTGGLSLRRISAIRRVLGFQERHNDSEPEDEWFGKRLLVMPGEKVATGLEGALAVENVLVDKPMGYFIRDGGAHLDPNVWNSPEVRRGVFEYCPELALIADMKLERERCPDDDRHGGRTEEMGTGQLARVAVDIDSGMQQQQTAETDGRVTKVVFDVDGGMQQQQAVEADQQGSILPPQPPPPLQIQAQSQPRV